MKFAQRQRAALVNLMEELGPLAPTKCEGWQTQDLAAHLYVREHRPDALPGIGLPRLADRTERIQMSELHSRGFLPIVSALRTPGWIMRPVDNLVNASEFFIHHEDVLRANGRSQTLTAQEQQQLWPIVKVLARKTQRAYEGQLLITRTDTGAEQKIGKGNRPLHLSGLPSELLLHLSGREADVDVTGEPESVERWRSAVGGL